MSARICRRCNGSGTDPEPRRVWLCCGNGNNGECCGNPMEEQMQQPYSDCAGYGEHPDPPTTEATP